MLLNAPTENAMLVDLEGTILAINQVGVQRLGKSEDELIGMRMFDYLPRDVAESRKAQADKVVCSGKPLRFQDERAGRFYDNNIYPVFDIDGKVGSLAIYASDITETKRAEDRLRQSEEKFRVAFENARDAILWADPETGLISNCNRAAEILLEKTKAEIIGTHQTTLHPPEKAQNYESMFKSHLENKGAIDDEAEVITRSGRIVPVHISASVTLVGNKTIIQGLFRDITERKRAEDALKAEKEFTETALNAQTDTFFVFEPSTGRAVRWNKAFSKISGYSDEEIRELKAPDSYYNEEDLKKAAAAVEEIFNKGAATIELTLRTKDGRSVPTEYTGPSNE